jgi:hypothetical protein
LLLVGGDAVYHVVSRTAFKRLVFDDEDKSIFVRMMRQQAVFCGLDVLAYTVMGNHFHLLIRVPGSDDPDDAELLRRYRAIYEDSHRSLRAVDPSVLEELLIRNAEDGQRWRDSLLARMGNLPVFMKELKQRFSILFNHRHENQGTIWSGRFRSLLVEGSARAMATVAAYIDLNALRAGLVEDPADYPFCGFAAALAGVAEARNGYLRMHGEPDWEEAIRAYRLHLYGRGYLTKGRPDQDYGRISAEVLDDVLRSGGRVEVSELLRRRVRYFVDGRALGSAAFVASIGREPAEGVPERRAVGPSSMIGADWEGLQVLRRLRGGLFG